MFTPKEIVANYYEIGARKVSSPAWKQFLLGILAGFLIGMGLVVANTAGHALENASVIRIVSGLLFAFGLGMVILMGAELFTGNCMIPISILEKKVTMGGMLRNWLFVYLGNFVGAVALAAGCAFFGQLGLSDGGLAVYTIKVAIAKCSLPFVNAIVLGIFCNLLVCIGVLGAISAKDTIGKVVGAYLPVAFFVISGFEHSIANMYGVPAGLFAMGVPAYASKAAAAGLNTGALSWGSFLVNNLLPVTIGNIIGGVAVGLLMYFAHAARGSEVKA